MSDVEPVFVARKVNNDRNVLSVVVLVVLILKKDVDIVRPKVSHTCICVVGHVRHVGSWVQKNICEVNTLSVCQASIVCRRKEVFNLGTAHGVIRACKWHEKEPTIVCVILEECPVGVREHVDHPVGVRSAEYSDGDLWTDELYSVCESSLYLELEV